MDHIPYQLLGGITIILWRILCKVETGHYCGCRLVMLFNQQLTNVFTSLNELFLECCPWYTHLLPKECLAKPRATGLICIHCTNRFTLPLEFSSPAEWDWPCSLPTVGQDSLTWVLVLLLKYIANFNVFRENNSSMVEKVWLIT